ncbi:MAG: sn-glycerol-1-phosphate dehydrogenase [Acutalibacteraceae bacterium]|jgi:glycerol-1-phosphate dehydrogenase [NAD(P)+]
MSINDLTGGINNCSCGRIHTCPVETIAIEKNALKYLPEICRGYAHILVVADENTWEVCGERAFSLLPLGADKIVLKGNGHVVIPNEEKIAEINKAITDKTDLIIGIGSGVINDLCKYVSFQHKIPYFIVATAPSMDGYVSAGAAMILEGMKITINCRPPKAIIADTEILKAAPLEMLRSGYGDIIGKYSCLNDWKLSALIKGEYFCQRVYDLVYSEIQNVKPLAKRIMEHDEAAIKTLTKALITVGIAMSYVVSSRPASGSEHHLAHFFEIKGILDQKPYFSHGIAVLYSSIVTARLREKIIASIPAKRAFDFDMWEKKIREIYLSSAENVIALQKKLGWYYEDDSDTVTQKWSDIAALLNQAPSSAEINRMAEEIGLRYSDFISMYGQEKIDQAVLYAKDMKDRYTVLWLYYTYFR